MYKDVVYSNNWLGIYLHIFFFLFKARFIKIVCALVTRVARSEYKIALQKVTRSQFAQATRLPLNKKKNVPRTYNRYTYCTAQHMCSRILVEIF